MSNGSLLITIVLVVSYYSRSFFFTVSQSLQSSLPFTSVNNTQSCVCLHVHTMHTWYVWSGGGSWPTAVLSNHNVHSIVHQNMHMHSICRYMRFTAAFKQQWATFSEPCLGKLLNEVMAIRGIHFLVTVHSHASHITAKYGITWPAHRSGLPMHSTCSVYTVTYTM